MAVSATHKGWRFDTQNDRLDALFNGTRVFSIDDNGLTIVEDVSFGTPVSTGWAITNFTADKEFAGNSTTAADAVKAVASLVNDLIDAGLLSGTVSA